jgi:hypothetical protein
MQVGGLRAPVAVAGFVNNTGYIFTAIVTDTVPSNIFQLCTQPDIISFADANSTRLVLGCGNRHTCVAITTISINTMTSFIIGIVNFITLGSWIALSYPCIN